MTKELETAIAKALADYGIDPASKGYTYTAEVVALLMAEDQDKL